MFEAFAGFDVRGANSGILDQLKQRLIIEDGDKVGGDIAKLLIQAAGQNRMDLVNQVGNYNRSMGRINY
jgi:conjugal transfer mating pair stabilization protein TraG